jgi:hypothetical protein
MRKVMISLISLSVLLMAEPTIWEDSYTLNCRNLTTGEEYQEKVEIGYSGKYNVYSDYYDVHRESGTNNHSAELGLVFNEILFSAFMCHHPISVFKKGESGLFAITVTEDGEITTKSSNGECPLELSPLDTSLAGRYAVEGTADDSSFTYSDTLILEPEGEIWSVSRVDHHPDYSDTPGSIETAGFGFPIDNTIVFTYYLDGKEFLKVFEIGEDTLKGRWVVYYWDSGINGAVITVGSETLTPVPESAKEE